MMFGLLSSAQTKLTNDTLNSFELKVDRDIKLKYKMLLIYLNDSSRKYLQIKQESELLASIPFPIADDEVKNFSIDKITTSKNGFKLNVSWGDWYFFNKREFVFTFRKNQFLLVVVKSTMHTFEPEKVAVKRKCLSVPIPIQKFKIIKFIEEI
jgi:hypothetical protein